MMSEGELSDILANCYLDESQQELIIDDFVEILIETRATLLDLFSGLQIYKDDHFINEMAAGIAAYEVSHSEYYLAFRRQMLVPPRYLQYLKEYLLSDNK